MTTSARNSTRTTFPVVDTTRVCLISGNSRGYAAKSVTTAYTSAGAARATRWVRWTGSRALIVRA